MSHSARPSLSTQRQVAAVEVGEESDTGHGWSYAVRVVWMDDTVTEHEVSLSWHDHDHWWGGGSPPHRVASAVVRVAGDALGRAGLPAKFDAAGIRRAIPDFDQRLR